MSAHTPAMSETSRRRVRPRHLWIIPGLAIAVYSNVIAGEHDLGLGRLIGVGGRE